VKLFNEIIVGEIILNDIIVDGKRSVFETYYLATKFGEVPQMPKKKNK
jgi:hypothetical protein